MSLEIEERAERVRRYLSEPHVQEAMASRCEENGHDTEGCCSLSWEIYYRCKWCGARA